MMGAELWEQCEDGIVHQKVGVFRETLVVTVLGIDGVVGSIAEGGDAGGFSRF